MSCPQASPIVAGLAIAGAAFVAKQAVQTYVKLSASGSIFSASKAFYKVGGSQPGVGMRRCMGWTLDTLCPRQLAACMAFHRGSSGRRAAGGCCAVLFGQAAGP